MLVVFDLDGTLIDSTQALLAAHDYAFSSMKLPRPSDAAILELVGLPLLETMQTLAPAENAAELARLYSLAYKKTAPEYERLFPGVKALLAKPFRAAVATGKSQSGAVRAVTRHGLAERFEVVRGGNSVPKPKPHPDLLHAIMAETKNSDLVMVGDTVYDLEMARAAGVRAVGVSWGHHSVRRLEAFAPVVSSMAELSSFLGF